MKNEIIELFPQHKIFVEGFGGAAHVLLSKSASEIDVYNDIDNGLYLFFKLLREEETRDELISKIQLTPYSRNEFYNCRDTYLLDTDDIEKARRFYIKTMQSFSSVGKSWSYSKNKSRRGMSQAVSKYLGNIDENMLSIVDRLRTIQIENLDIIDLIQKYDSKETLFYLDPPYVADERVSKKVYDSEMTVEKHTQLVDKLLHTNGKVILSGYENSIYRKLETNQWNKIELGEYKNRNGDKNAEKTTTKKEFVWTNFQK